MSKETGGPAFPGEDRTDYYYGMTLRDWFAGHVLQSMTKHETLDPKLFPDELIGKSIAECVAFVAYQYADAMLEAREEL